MADVAQKKDESSSLPEEAVVDTDDVKELEEELENTHISEEGKDVAEKIEQEEEAASKMEADKSSEEEKDVKELEEEFENTHISEEGKEVIQKLEQEEEAAGDSEAQKDIDEDGEKKADQRIEAIVDNEKPMQTPQSPVPPTKKNINQNKSSKQSSKQTPSVDEAAMEPMHPAVITTLHALCMVISSESKTHKMIETSLECITILTNGRYVSGVAGGRMKLEVQRKMSKDLSNEKGEGDSADNDNTPGSPSSPVKVYGAHNGIQLTTSKGHDGRDGGLSFLGYVVESITRASDSSSEVVQGCMAKALLSIMTCPKCGVHEAAMLQAVRSTFHVYLVGKSVSGKDLAKRTLVDMLKCVFMRMEAYDIISKDNNVGSSSDDDKQNGIDQSKSGDESVGTATTAATSNADDPSTSVGAFASQYHTDSYLLFRALCKLSSKTLPGDENVGMVPPTGIGSSAMMQGMSATFFSSTPTVDPLALNSKILSLELILAVFEHCGDAFQNGEKFVYAVQSYLCVSLLKNCMSNHTVVAHLSLKIFLLLVSKVYTLCLIVNLS